MRVIEICNNDEWLTLYGPLSDIENYEPQSDACETWVDVVWAAVASTGYKPSLPQGERITCHGWHGCNTFKRHGHGLGTFDDLTDAEWDELTGIATDAAASVVEMRFNT